MGLFKKQEQTATPLQEAVRELEEIDERLEDGADDELDREELLERRRELMERIAEMRGEGTTTDPLQQTEPRRGLADDQLSSLR